MIYINKFLSVDTLKFRTNITLFNKDIRFFLGIFPAYTTWKKGITNRCADGRFVLFLDYDDPPIEWITDELKLIQEQFCMGDIYLFKTSKGYHAINTEKRSFWEIVKIMHLTSCDPNYIMVPLKYALKAWTLRVSDKKGKPKTKYLKTLKSKGILQQSKPHNFVLRNVYKVSIPTNMEDKEKHFYNSDYPYSE